MKKVLIAVVVVLLVGAGVYATFLRGGAAGTTTQAAPIAPVQEEEQLVAEAHVVPLRSAALSLPTGGIVAEVLVAEGQQLQAGQVLLRLDRARASAMLAQAQAELTHAQAAFDQLRAGASPQELAAAQAELHAAEAQQRETGGSVTPADVAAAQAQLAQAQTHQAQLRAGANRSDLRAAEAALAEAQASLVTQRDQLSAAKTTAQLQMQQAVDELTEAQASYATALRNWQYVEETGRDPNAIVDSSGKKIHLKLGDREKQQYYDAYVQAEAAMHIAETAVTQAQVTYDTARQAEVSGIQAAEQQLASTQASLDKLRAGADANELAAARAELASGKASLDKLRGEQRGGALEGAQAAVEQAQASLDKLRAGTSKGELAVAAAEVQSAEAAVKLAEVGVNETELRAPFAGTVAALDVQAGEYVAPGTAVVHLADLSAWQLETTDLTELNVVQVREGSQAAATFDAIPGLELVGKVSRIRALGQNKQGEITYVATIKLDRIDPRLRWNMVASVTIAR